MSCIPPSLMPARVVGRENEGWREFVRGSSGRISMVTANLHNLFVSFTFSLPKNLSPPARWVWRLELIKRRLWFTPSARCRWQTAALLPDVSCKMKGPVVAGRGEAWLSFKVDGCDVCGVRGCICSQDLAAGSKLVYIPGHHWLVFLILVIQYENYCHTGRAEFLQHWGKLKPLNSTDVKYSCDLRCTVTNLLS